MNNGAVLEYDDEYEFSYYDELGLEYDEHRPEQSRSKSKSMSRSREISGEQLNNDLEFVSNAGKERPYREFDQPSTSWTGNHERNSSGFRTDPDDDEEIDDAMLVMPGSNHRRYCYQSQPERRTISVNILILNIESPLQTSLPSNYLHPLAPRAQYILTPTLPLPMYLPIFILYQSTQSAPCATYSRGKARSTISVERSESICGTSSLTVDQYELGLFFVPTIVLVKVR
ncbi:hypothetical protein DFJ43DRAFT_1150588 [Lentinula guzmanii]|uniref:Uncharacterized protein n=1 Tax=Lentinula guzmanii TaxID=2804957 RepID=A0AA38JT70_9AGAR|nr:hypothetical protein DFJ43DRAFT_1150588 [Lentinula guzmanii]